MDDVVAIKATFGDRSTRYCMTWGRLFGAIDPQGLLDAVRPHMIKPEDESASLSVCDSLQEASRAEYFYEALIHFGQHPIPFGPGYEAWADGMRADIRSGRQIYYLGIRQPAA
jgi:hypothetical protein